MRYRLVGTTLFVAGLLFFTLRFCASQFCYNNIRFDQEFPTSIVLDGPTESQLNQILAQPFTYLDRGRQSFVFVSADGQYVLKFFDAYRLKHSKPKKYARLFEGYEVAYLRDRDNTGLVFAKLGAHYPLHHVVHLTDRFGRKHRVPLQSVPFVIQRRATPMRVIVSELLDLGDVQGVKDRMGQILELYLDEYRRGLRDRDRNFMYNTGFIGDRAIRIDVGRLAFSEHYKSPRVRKRDLHKIMGLRTHKWLQRHYPEYTAEIMESISQTFQSSGL